MDQDSAEKKQVLLIGENAECVDLIARTLEEIGLLGALEVSRDCQSAWTQLQRSNPHCPRLILLDLDLPEGTAFRFMESVKADPTLRMIPIIVLAAADNPETVAASYGLGAAGYLVRKELGPEFAAKLRSACGYWALSRVPAT